MKFLETFETINTENIGLVGHSLGAAIAVMYAKKNKNIKSMVLLAPALNLHDLITDWYSKQQIYELKLKGKINISKHTITELFFNESHETDATKDFVELETPALLIHGKDDDTVPVKYITPFFTQQGKTKEIEILEGADHELDDIKTIDIITRKTIPWFEKWMN